MFTRVMGDYGSHCRGNGLTCRGSPREAHLVYRGRSWDVPRAFRSDLAMADEPDRTLIKASMAHYASSHGYMDEANQLIKQSRKAVRSSRELLERTRPIDFSDLVARWSARARTILFVDDDDLVRDSVSKIIEGDGLRA